MNKCLPKVGIILFPWASVAPYKFVEEMTKILSSISSSIIVITSNGNRIERNLNTIIIDIGLKFHYVSQSSFPLFSKILWIFKSIIFQLLTSIELIKNRENLDLVFFLAHPYHTLPLGMCRLLGIKSIELVTRGKVRNPNLLGKLAMFSEGVSYYLCSFIAVEIYILSKNINKRYHKKIIGEAARYVNIESIKKETPVELRAKKIAYIGRFRREKGIMDFIKAIPAILGKTDSQILIVGGGDLEYEILDFLAIQPEEIRKRITMIEWVPKEEVLAILGEVMVLVLPSESEGLPTIILEAMAKGTIVLATAVGGLEDIIIDGETGFILRSSAPDSISENVIKILSNLNLQQISLNAHRYIKENYSFNAAFKRYEILIEKAMNRG